LRAFGKEKKSEKILTLKKQVNGKIICEDLHNFSLVDCPLEPLLAS
jgi:hypothetical protein